MMQKKTKRQVNARRDKLRQSKQFKPAELPEAAVPKTDEDDRDFMPRLVIGHLSICVNGTLIDDIDSAICIPCIPLAYRIRATMLGATTTAVLMTTSWYGWCVF
jgi:hypothetical protein